MPLEAAIEKVCCKYKDLFCLDALRPNLMFGFSYNGLAVEVSIPEDEDIGTTLLRMRSEKAPGLT